MMEIIEHHTWHMTLMGRFGDYPPHDPEGFLAFARALHTPKLYDLIKDAERVSDFTSYRFPTSARWHYERLTTFPEGFVVLGDAMSRRGAQTDPPGEPPGRILDRLSRGRGESWSNPD